jgi:hypothetical protein
VAAIGRGSVGRRPEKGEDHVAKAVVNCDAAAVKVRATAQLGNRAGIVTGSRAAIVPGRLARRPARVEARDAKVVGIFAVSGTASPAAASRGKRDPRAARDVVNAVKAATHSVTAGGAVRRHGSSAGRAILPTHAGRAGNGRRNRAMGRRVIRREISSISSIRPTVTPVRPSRCVSPGQCRRPACARGVTPSGGSPRAACRSTAAC